MRFYLVNRNPVARNGRWTSKTEEKLRFYLMVATCRHAQASSAAVLCFHCFFVALTLSKTQKRLDNGLCESHARVLMPLVIQRPCEAAGGSLPCVLPCVLLSQARSCREDLEQAHGKRHFEFSADNIRR